MSGNSGLFGSNVLFQKNKGKVYVDFYFFFFQKDSHLFANTLFKNFHTKQKEMLTSPTQNLTAVGPQPTITKHSDLLGLGDLNGAR